MSSKAIAAAAVLAIASCPAWAQSPPAFKANILIVTAPDDLTAWMQMTPEQQVGSGRVRDVQVGQKIYFPIVVTGLQPPAEGRVNLSADFELLTPNGEIAYAKKALATAVVENRPDMTTVSLGPVVDILVEAGDANGVYLVRTVVTDGTRSVVAAETFKLDGAPEKARVAPAAAAPRLQMGEPPKKNPGNGRDVRDCLTLPTTAEVIKCTEKKKQ